VRSRIGEQLGMRHDAMFPAKRKEQPMLAEEIGRLESEAPA
jgi:hypothetical protein